MTHLATASVYMPYARGTTTRRRGAGTVPRTPPHGRELRLALRRRQSLTSASTAMAIPGYGVAEQVFVGGFSNFLSLYNLVITARILLSWFPQAAGVAALQPVYAITDPYLNLFRGIIPPLGGLDLSPILAFLLLNALTSATAAVGAELPPAMRTTSPKRFDPSSFGKSHRQWGRTV
jgi:YggT family protein